MYAQPLLIDRLINFINDKEQKSNTIGFFYIFILFLTSFCRTFNTLHYNYGDFIIGQQMKIGLQNLIFRKSLKLSSSARKETTVGEMVIIWADFKQKNTFIEKKDQKFNDALAKHPGTFRMVLDSRTIRNEVKKSVTVTTRVR